MRDEDDTVRTDKQAHEDALLAMLEAGAVPGFAMGSIEDVEDARSPLVIARVSRDCFDGGAEVLVASALAMRDRLLSMPEQGRGATVLAFDGWASDPRPLFAVREVFVFARALLFGESFGWIDNREECVALARPMIEILFDERVAWEGEPDPYSSPDHPEILEAAGSLWLVAHAFAPDVFSAHPSSPTGFVRDLGANLAIADSLRSFP
jgi:hypothetical protein